MKTERPLSILLLTRNFPPLRGGMERLVHALTLELLQQDAVRVIGPAGCAAFLPAGTAARGVPLRPLPVFFLGVLAAGLRALWRQRPDVVLCGSGLMAPIGWLLARLSGARLVCLLHGLDIVAPQRLYQTLFLPAIRRCDVLVANSRQTAQLAVAAGIPPHALAVVHPGVAEPAAVAPEAVAAFRTRHGLGKGPVMVSVGRITRRKGLLEFLQQALPDLLRRHPDAVLLVVGGEARHALGKARLPLLPALEAEIAQRGWSARVHLLGEIDDAELALVFAAADVHVFPVLALPGDVEGFGMVALEAAAAGVPTVAFAVGGVPDAVAPGLSGRLVPPGDYPALVEALGPFLHGPRPAQDAAIRDFARGFSWASRGAALRALLAGAAPPPADGGGGR